MSLSLAGVSRRKCPKCDSFNFWCEITTIGESYEICEKCGYVEKGKDVRSFRKIGNKPFDPRNYIKDIEGDYHYHGRYGFHKKSVKHRRINGQLYAFNELKMKWKDLFKFLKGEEACNFRKVKGETTWSCDSKTLTFTQNFCEEHGIDFEKVKQICNDTGGYCDCEVLFNTVSCVNGEEELPERVMKMGEFVCRCCGNPARWNSFRASWECDFCGLISGEWQNIKKEQKKEIKQNELSKL